MKSSLDSLLIQILLRRLENEFPDVPATSIVEAIVWAENDTFPDETIEDYTSRIREFVNANHVETNTAILIREPFNSQQIYMNSRAGSLKGLDPEQAARRN